MSDQPHLKAFRDSCSGAFTVCAGSIGGVVKACLLRSCFCKQAQSLFLRAVVIPAQPGDKMTYRICTSRKFHVTMFL